MEYKVDCQESIQNAFLEYGASVAQERSIIDVRDGIKLGLRQGLYAQYTNKLTHKNPFKKAIKSVSAAMSQSYVHGDAACYSTFIRAAKPWSYRYPLEEAQGSFGTQCGPDTESSARYVEMRASELSDYLFDGIKKNNIAEWYMNYDDTEEIPSVLPSIGFWNIVNGTTGIAVAMATSVPQFNLKEVNSALVKLIRNPDIDFSEIYCAPDFCGGGTILNGAEVKESLRVGNGKTIRMRAKLEYDPKKNVIKASELPYGVFTDTILGQLSDILSKDENYGISSVTDHTKQWADIWIYLDKGVDPDVMMRKLYKDTSLENHFAINMIMLDNGRFPKVFGWKDACQAYINHIRTCKTRELAYDRDTLLARNHILEGLLIALANIDDVIALIRGSESAAEAKTLLMSTYSLDEEQAKAILDIKLQRLAHLEAIKVNNELEKNCAEITNLNDILNNQSRLDELLIVKLEEVANKFGDARRTRITNTLHENEIELPDEDVYISISVTGLKRVEKKNAQAVKTSTRSNLIAFTADGKMYRIKVADICLGEISKYKSLLGVSAGNVIAIFDEGQIKSHEYIFFATRNGYVKKCTTSDYYSFGRNGSKCTKMKEDDKLIDVRLCTSSTGFITYNDGKVSINVATMQPSNKLTYGTYLKEVLTK